jgi:diguanylate cyclase (GGDEF)-like protein
MRGFIFLIGKIIYEKVGELLFQQSKLTSTIIGFGFLILVGGCDYLTGYELIFSIFYLLPISIFAWSVSTQAGIAVAILSEITETSTDLLGGLYFSHIFVHSWNAAVKTLFFVIFSYTLSKLRIAYNKEKRLAREDTLTGIANQTTFFELADSEIERCNRYSHPVTLAYLDCDNFKAVNDTLGHRTGDMVLRKVAAVLRKNTRDSDIVARLGGDEFAVMLPETGFEESEAALISLRKALLDAMHENQWPVTFSIGVITFARPHYSAEEILHKADDLMYAVKKGEKDSINHEIYR